MKCPIQNIVYANQGFFQIGGRSIAETDAKFTSRLHRVAIERHEFTALGDLLHGNRFHPGRIQSDHMTELALLDETHGCGR